MKFKFSRSFLIALTITLLLTGTALAAVNGWEPVGTAGFSTGGAWNTSLALDGSGTPFVAYSDFGIGNKATVMKYDGTSWVTVGAAGFSAGGTNYISLALDGAGTPYVAYRDSANSSKATVMKYDGTTWVNVGAEGFSAGEVSRTSLALDVSGTPYVAYMDDANSSKATVMKYDGTNWVNVGAAGFSGGLAEYISLALDGAGTPFVAYSDVGIGWKATVMKYDGTNWVNVGAAGFSAGGALYTSLALDGAGKPYVAYRDFVNGNRTTVMKFDGTNWGNVGAAGFSAGEAHFISLALDGAGTPYVAYSDSANSSKATVMKYDGANWGNVGAAGFSAAAEIDTSLALDGAGTPYVAYSDSAIGYKATVMRVAAPRILPGANTLPTDGTALAVGIDQLTVEFNVDVMDDGGAGAANQVNNYLLFSDNGDGFQTVDCASGVHANDVEITIDQVSYDDNADAGPFIAIIDVNNNIPLPPGEYRFLVCGTTSIESTFGVELNYGLSDAALNFTVSVAAAASGGGSSTTDDRDDTESTSSASMPDTGFAPERVTILATEPLAYASTDMVLTIPKLGIEQTIVGVAESAAGWDVSWLGNSVGYLAGTAFPTWAGNTALTGHVWNADGTPGVFYDLNTLQQGDRFTIEAWGQTYTYEVTGSEQVYAHNLSVLDHSDYDVVTLITCEDYSEYTESYSFRRVVTAILIEVE